MNELWEWLVDQPQDTVMELLAFLASGSINAVRQHHDSGSARMEHTDQLARSAELDMTKWWSADETFLTRLNKRQIVGAVNEGDSPEAAAPLTKLPKAAAVHRAAQAMKGRGWLPSPLRTPKVEVHKSTYDLEQPYESEPLAA